MTKVNDDIFQMLLHTLREMSIQSAELEAFWAGWITSGHYEAWNKGYDY